MPVSNLMATVNGFAVRQMALRKDPLKAFPAMDQRRDIVACGESRVFIPCQSHQGEQESRMPLLPEQCAFPHGTHRHMLYPLFRQYARDGDDAVPVGVGLDDRHERRVAGQQCFQVMPKVFKVDGDDGTLKNMGPPRSSALLVKKQGQGFWTVNGRGNIPHFVSRKSYG